MFFDWKNKTYNIILVIIAQLTKIIYYKLVKIMIDIFKLAKKNFDIIIYYYNLLNSIIIDKNILFILKF